MDPTALSFGQNFLKRQGGLNHIVFWSKLSKKTLWLEPYCLLVKTFEKDTMARTILSFGQNFQKRQYGLTILLFGRNFLKRQYGLNHIVFWSKLSKKTLWVEPYCLLVKPFEKELNHIVFR